MREYLREARYPGFSLIEIAIIMVIIGLVIATTLPLVNKQLQTDISRSSKKILRSAREEIIGYAMSNCALPEDDNATAFGHIEGRLRSAIRYRPARGLTWDDDIDDTYLSLNNATREVTGIPIETADGDTVYAAFVVADYGKNRSWDGTDNYTYDSGQADSGREVRLERLSEAFDDIVDYVLLDELAKYTPRCETEEGGGPGGGGEDPGGGPGGASEFVLTAGGDYSIPNTGNIDGDVFSQGAVTMNNDSVITGNLAALGDIVLISDAEVQGSLCSGGDVELQQGTDVYGPMDVSGDLTFGYDSHAHEIVRVLGGVTMNTESTVDGDLHAGGDISMGWMVNASQNVYSGSDIIVGNGATVQGDALAVGTVDNQGTVNGSTSGPPPDLQSPEACSNPDIPPQTSFSAGGPDVSLGYNIDDVISPGSYGELNAGGLNDITLTEGQYYFQEISVDWDSSFYLDLSGGGDIEIFIEGDVSLSGSLNIFVDTGSGFQAMTAVDSDEAARVYAESHGSWTMETQSEWFGTINSLDDLTFGDSNVLIGSFHSASDVTMPNNISMTYVQSNYAAANW